MEDKVENDMLVSRPGSECFSKSIRGELGFSKGAAKATSDADGIVYRLASV